MSCLKSIATAAMVIALGCTNTAKRDTQVRKEMMAMGPIVLPNAMCAQQGTVAMSADKEGERMICELQPVLGSHVPRCVCVDEGFSERERELAFEQLRGLGIIDPCGGSTLCAMGNVGSTSLGTK